ncbi:methylmalonyl-CoA epimerase [Niallia sp. XMNu-256]|uniref:methylmalonyl-CoA epimerase n=1 Tax=Niallia sp. XMNu-256 TaxID=3082444 RepID=UPI0030D50556
MIQKVDHIGIAVHSIEKSLSFYTEVLKLRLIRIEEVKTQHVKVAFLDGGETKLELLEPTSSESAISKFIGKYGQGIHHIALSVHSIEDRIRELQEKGITMIDSQPRKGASNTDIAFIHPKSSDNVLFEICEKKGMEHGEEGYV